VTASDKVTIFFELVVGLPMLAVGIMLTTGGLFGLLGWWLR
jgi:hypothetical protein